MIGIQTSDIFSIMTGWLWSFLIVAIVCVLSLRIFTEIVARCGLNISYVKRLNFWQHFAVLFFLGLATLLCFVGLVNLLANKLQWGWFPNHFAQLAHGLWMTVQLLVLSVVFGFFLAVPIGLVQVNGPKFLALLAGSFCTLIRSTPLLVQIWLLYYGLGSFFPLFPELRQTILWPILSEGYYYALLALTLSFAGYEGEVMRGAFLGVPRGELEAARSFGMPPFLLLRRIWLPRALRLALPTLGGEIIAQLKSTPLASTVTVMELFNVANRIRAKTLLVYEPLLVIALVYCLLVYLLTKMIKAVENQVPMKSRM